MTMTALVTGANRGIGLEVVRGLAKAGCKVLMGCRNAEEGEQAKKELVGDDIHVIELNLSNENAIEDAMTQAKAVYGDIDILVNNAGVLAHKSLNETGADDMNEAFQVHVKAPLALIQHVLPAMQEKGMGRIINVSSGWGAFNENMEGPLPYAVTKAALNALTVNVARQLEDYPNVKINSVCPGWVHTRMGGKDAPRTPEQGAETIVWAALSDESKSGQFYRDKKTIKW